MRTLNRDAADALRPFEPNAVTDVTGFGLLGHAHEIAVRSGVRLELDARRPARSCRGRSRSPRPGERTGGDRRNREFAGRQSWRRRPATPVEALAYDPQTAGGLLIALPAARGAVLEAEFAARGLFARRASVAWRPEPGSGCG